MAKANFEREIRNRIRLTQEEFANLLGTDRGMISKAENSAKRMSLSSTNRLMEIANCLNGKEATRKKVEAKVEKDLQASFAEYLYKLKVESELKLIVLKEKFKTKEAEFKLAATDLEMFKGTDWGKNKKLKAVDPLWKSMISGNLQVLSDEKAMDELHRMRFELMKLELLKKNVEKEIKKLQK